MSLFQASQHTVTISSYDLKTRLDSQLSRMNRQMFSMGFSSGALGRVPRGARRPGDLVLLAGPRVVLPPELYRGSGRARGSDRLQRGGNGFLKFSMANSFCA